MMHPNGLWPLFGIISMRRILGSAAFALAALAALPALAADMAGPPVLRGALPSTEQGVDFAGFYVGGYGAYNSATSRSENNGLDPNLQRLIGGYVIEPTVRGLPLVEVGRGQRGRIGYGAFAGYNMAIDDMIVGAELDYTRAELDGSTYGSRSGRTVDSSTGTPTTYDWTVTANKAYKISEFGSLRARLGYAYGQFMPHISGGLAYARASSGGDASVASTQFTAAAPVPVANVYTPSYIQSGQRMKFHFGYAIGAGVDVLMAQNILLRAEVQHLRFSDVGGYNVSINTARVGAAVKF